MYPAKSPHSKDPTRPRRYKISSIEILTISLHQQARTTVSNRRNHSNVKHRQHGFQRPEETFLYYEKGHPDINKFIETVDIQAEQIRRADLPALTG
jgi:hypothetical protein